MGNNHSNNKICIVENGNIVVDGRSLLVLDLLRYLFLYLVFIAIFFCYFLVFYVLHN